MSDSAKQPSRSQPSRSRFPFGLRSKLILISLLLAFIPVLVVWSIGIYEDLARGHIAGEVREIGSALAEQVKRRKLSLAKLDEHRPWLTEFAKANHVMIRLIDPHGNVVFQTQAIDAERWANIQRGWLRRAGDFFFGPHGPPD